MPTSNSDALVLFGVTGDLAHKMTFPALYAMTKRGNLNVPLIGVAFPKWSLARLRKRVTDSIKRQAGSITSVPSTIFCRGLSTSAETIKTRTHSPRSKRRWATLDVRRTTSPSRLRSSRR